MIDPKLLRQSTAEVARNLARRGFRFDTENYLALEERRKALQVETESLRSKRNASAKTIGKAKARGEEIEPLLAAVKDLGDKLESSETDLQEVLAALDGELDEHALAEQVKRNTRAYVKRQRAWYRKEPGVHWLDAGDAPEALVDAALALWRRAEGASNQAQSDDPGPQAP